MTGYTKLFGSIVLSTIWRESNHIRIVWITMLALADKRGIVEGSIPGLADLCRVTVEECREALQKLLSPDPDSRSKEQDGRRLMEVEGGWLLVNHAKYRQKLRSDDRREYLTIKQREHRAKRKATSTKCQQSEQSEPSQPIAEASSEAEAVRTEDASRQSRTTSKFVKPTREELDLHAAKIGLASTEVDKFVNHYESNGWKVGRNPMRSWPHALVNWKLNQQTYETHQRNSGQRPAIDRNAGTLNAGKASEYANVGKYLPVSDPQRRDA